jgi:rhodanese-related sulfurtransferase
MKRIAVLLTLLIAIGCSGSETSNGIISQSALLDRLDDADAPLVLDVRTTGEFQRGHVPGAVNIPYQQLGARLSELGEVNGRDVVVYCEAGPRAQRAEATLRTAGFERLYHLEGDMSAWRRSQLPVEMPR